MSAEHHATDPKSLCTCKECQPTAKPLAQRVEEECVALQNQADCANDEELGEKDSESLECVRRIGLYRSQQTEIERLRETLAWTGLREAHAKIERLRAAFETFIGEVNEAEGDYAIGLAMTKAEKALGACIPLYCTAGPGCVALDNPQSVKSRHAEVTSALEEYWLKHYLSKEGMCSLCGQSGKIDSTGVETPAGIIVGRVNYCICPNGTKMRELKAAI